jgi:glutamate racemase
LTKKSPIAIFDSGVGGLTVARQLHRMLPGEKLIYFGDTARVPYGTKSPEVIRQYAIQITQFLSIFDPKMIIIACHSVSSIGKAFLKKRFPGYVFFDVIEPSIEDALKSTRNKRIGVIGTPATISSGRYVSMIKTADASVRTYQKACPLLVPFVEEGWLNGDIVEAVIKRYIQGLLSKDIDTIILGCTHYPLLKKSIRKVVGDSVNLIDASYATGRKIVRFLRENNLCNSPEKKVPLLYFSDLPSYKRRTMFFFWRNRNLIIKKVSLNGKHICLNSL